MGHAGSKDIRRRRGGNRQRLNEKWASECQMRLTGTSSFRSGCVERRRFECGSSSLTKDTNGQTIGPDIFARSSKSIGVFANRHKNKKFKYRRSETVDRKREESRDTFVQPLAKDVENKKVDADGESCVPSSDAPLPNSDREKRTRDPKFVPVEGNQSDDSKSKAAPEPPFDVAKPVGVKAKIENMENITNQIKAQIEQDRRTRSRKSDISSDATSSCSVEEQIAAWAQASTTKQPNDPIAESGLVSYAVARKKFEEGAAMNGLKNDEIFRNMEELGLGFVQDGKWVPTDVISRTIWDKVEKKTGSGTKWGHRSKTFVDRLAQKDKYAK